MDKYNTWWGKTLTWISLKIISKMEWSPLKALFNGGVYWDLKEEDHNKLRELLKPGYFIILNRRKTHFTTYLISIANFIKTGKFATYSHAFMNVDANTDNDYDFKFMEATGVGVHCSTFMQVFDCDCVALLRPKGFTTQDWVEVVDGLLQQEGKKYDCLFDVSDDNKLSCVELVRRALQFDDNYAEKFKAFEAMISKAGNLTPQMLYDCPDFEVVYEVRR